MSSRRLLLLIERLPEDGSFKTAWRDGDWTIDRQFAKEQLNAIRALRADMRVMLGFDGLDFDPILSPGDTDRQEITQQQSREQHDDVIARLRGEKQD
jgi:hypothetical protein